MNSVDQSLFVFKAIRERILAANASVDEETLADTLEGLTDIHEVLAAVVRSALLDEAMVDGLKGHMQRLQARLDRLAERASERRRVARDAMAEADIKKVVAPDFTLSLRPVPPALVVIDEARSLNLTGYPGIPSSTAQVSSLSSKQAPQFRARTSPTPNPSSA
jgi:hypothetical protein